MRTLQPAGAIAGLLFVTATATHAREPAPQARAALNLVAGTWAPSAAQCADPNTRVNQRVTIDAEAQAIYDNRAGDIECTVKKQLQRGNAVALGLTCTYGQEGPFDFETAVVVRRTGERSLLYTNIQVGGGEQTLPLVRCDKQTGYPPANPTDALATPASASEKYVLPPLKEGEFYAGNTYPADYAEQRQTLLDDGAKPLAVTPRDASCAKQKFCTTYPEARTCARTPDGAPYCVARWQTKDAATVDYVVNPTTLEVLKKVCRDTCGADEIRPQAR